jgi:hypothetical protein
MMGDGYMQAGQTCDDEMAREIMSIFQLPAISLIRSGGRTVQPYL